MQGTTITFLIKTEVFNFYQKAKRVNLQVLYITWFISVTLLLKSLSPVALPFALVVTLAQTAKYSRLRFPHGDAVAGGKFWLVVGANLHLVVKPKQNWSLPIPVDHCSLSSGCAIFPSVGNRPFFIKFLWHFTLQICQSQPATHDFIKESILSPAFPNCFQLRTQSIILHIWRKFSLCLDRVGGWRITYRCITNKGISGIRCGYIRLYHHANEWFADSKKIVADYFSTQAHQLNPGHRQFFHLNSFGNIIQ